ncbi:MAG TPA: hypothetical protein VFF36_15075, partial [Planctomycetota bacterium]|nr:hypothetical protein [Planctomycetota bacterium]
MLRHSILCAYVTAASSLLGRPAPPREEELVEIDVDEYPEAGRPMPWTPWDLLDATYGGTTVGRFLDANDVANSELTAARTAVTALADHPPELLERLLAETLDLCSHRLDAWMTSFAVRRLRSLRAAGRNTTLIGGYGFLEDLAPATTASTSQGYVQAPSLTHATAAAILASGYLAHAGRGDARALAIDLSSTRVNRAITLLEGVRAGQPLGALLGYRFERALQEAGAADAIDDFRRAFPPAATRIEAGAPPMESVVAATVVDGLRLQRAWAKTDRTGTAFGTPPWPVVVKVNAVKGALAALDEAVDALGDAVLAESVYQVARGNPVRAAAALDAMAAGGSLPPELEVVSTPRTGIALTHRLLVLLPPSTT